MIVVVGPSGAGKSTFVDKVIAENPLLRDTVTYTTRAMRPHESEGNPYHFVGTQKFEDLIQENFFVEWAKVHNNHYGTPFYQIQEAWEQGLAIIMDVDVQGAKTFKDKFPQALTVFINPPSIDALRQRVLKRDQGTTKDLELRMKNAIKEMSLAGDFDVQLINDDFDKSYREFKKKIEEYLESD